MLTLSNKGSTDFHYKFKIMGKYALSHSLEKFALPIGILKQNFQNFSSASHL